MNLIRRYRFYTFTGEAEWSIREDEIIAISSVIEIRRNNLGILTDYTYQSGISQHVFRLFDIAEVWPVSNNTKNSNYLLRDDENNNYFGFLLSMASIFSPNGKTESLKHQALH